MSEQASSWLCASCTISRWTSGLIPRDYRYLALLPADRGARGLQMVASQLHLEEAEIEESVEPFLIQLQLIERDPRGRKITEHGLELLRNHEARSTT